MVKVTKKWTFEKKVSFLGQYGYQSIALDEIYKNMCHIKYLTIVIQKIFLDNWSKKCSKWLFRCSFGKNPLKHTNIVYHFVHLDETNRLIYILSIQDQYMIDKIGKIEKLKF